MSCSTATSAQCSPLPGTTPAGNRWKKALTLAKAAAAHDSYAAAVLLAGYEKDKAAAAALLGDFRAVAAAGLRGAPAPL